MTQLKPITAMIGGKQMVVCEYLEAQQAVQNLEEQIRTLKADRDFWKLHATAP